MNSSCPLFTSTGRRQNFPVAMEMRGVTPAPINRRRQESTHKRHQMDTYPFPGPSSRAHALLRKDVLTRRAASGSSSLSAKAVGLRFSMRKGCSTNTRHPALEVLIVLLKKAQNIHIQTERPQATPLLETTGKAEAETFTHHWPGGNC